MKIHKNFIALFALFALLLTSSAVNAQGKVWRVNNRPGINANFTTVQAAHNSAAVHSGDTLYLEASDAGNYGNLTLTKKLVIIGPGNMLGWNDSTQAFKHQAIIPYLRFNSGSGGSEVIGCRMYRCSIYGVSNITLARNYIGASDNNSTYWYYEQKCSIFIYRASAGSLNNIVIKQNWIYQNSYRSKYPTNSNYFGTPIYIRSNVRPKGFVICNNVIKQHRGTGNGRLIHQERNDMTNDMLVQNNILINGQIRAHYAFFVNNIWVSGNGFYDSNNNFSSHNILSGTQLPTTAGGFPINNVQNVDMTTVFRVPAPSKDNEYQLSPTSPAKGAGINNSDCGIFEDRVGGEAYYLSELPGIPAIFESKYGVVGLSEIPVVLKSKSHK